MHSLECCHYFDLHVRCLISIMLLVLNVNTLAVNNDMLVTSHNKQCTMLLDYCAMFTRLFLSNNLEPCTVFVFFFIELHHRLIKL